MSHNDRVQKALERIAQLPPKRLALLAAELYERDRAAHEPIAIVGTACRLPNGSDTPDAFWKLLERGGDGVSTITGARRELSGERNKSPGEAAARWGAFLENIEQFDARFFGISAKEADAMDPQQRLLLEVAWEAAENSNIAPDKLNGSDTGVFVGISGVDFTLRAGGAEKLDGYLLTGAANSIAAGRLSYALGLQGPSVAVDTSCSASASAIHLACQSLRAQECSLALAAGVNLILLAHVTESVAAMQMLAPDGRCKTFSEGANGYVRGEGCVVVVLKRLSDAVEQNDNICGIIRGSAWNQDGRSSGLTAPNGVAQERVIRAALKNAGLKPADIDYVEAHGTGTALGDPIEIAAIGRVFAEARSADQPLVVGSVKTNIGHLESAAGIAGVLKVLLALEHERIPPHLHASKLNPRIDWDKLPIRIPTSGEVWKRGHRKRIAGISSFGFSGTNVSIIIEESPVSTESAELAHGASIPVTASAKSREALQNLAQRHRDFLAHNPSQSLASFAAAANTGRSHFAHRLAATVSSIEEARRLFDAFSAGDARSSTHYSYITAHRPPEITFVFAPEWSRCVAQYMQVKDELAFREAFERCRRAYDKLQQSDPNVPGPAESNSGSMMPGDGIVALFAFQVALSALWQHWGVLPTIVAGRGPGEYAAACVAGALSIEDGMLLAATHEVLLSRSIRVGSSFIIDAALQDEFRERTSIVTVLEPQISYARSGSNKLDRRYFAAIATHAEEKQDTADLGSDSRHAHVFIGSENAEHASGSKKTPTVLENLVEVYLSGAAINWSVVNRASGSLPKLPNYPFQRQRYWIASEPGVSETSNDDKSHSEEPSDWLYGITWQDAEIEDRDANAHSGPSAIVASLTDKIRELETAQDFTFFEPFRLAAAKLSISCIAKAFDHLGITLVRGSCIEVADLCSSMNVAPAHSRLLRRVFEILELNGIIASQGAGWEVRKELPANDPRVEIEKLRQDYPQCKVELDLAERALQLGSVLKGERSGVDLLFPGGSFELAESLYQKTVSATVLNDLVAAVVSAAFDVSSETKLRVLEIGAGTGGTTASILPQMPSDRTEYIFTDVSTTFLVAARRKFAKRYPFVRYGLFDVEKGTLPEGISEETCDIVVAANVLHATASLRNTISNVRQMVRPGGYLVLLEVSCSEPITDLTFGALEGWLKYQDHDLRPHGALLPSEKWVELLGQMGFEAQSVLKASDFGGIAGTQSIIIARRRTAAGPELTVAGAAVGQILVAADVEADGEALAAELRKSGATVVLASNSPEYSRALNDRAQLSFASKAQWESLLCDVSSGGGLRCIVHVKTSNSSGEESGRTLQLELAARLGAVVASTQALLTTIPSPSPIWVVSRGAHSAAGASFDLASSALPAYGRVLVAEHPEINATFVDLDPAAPNSGWSQLARMIVGDAPRSREFAFRGGRVVTPQLTALSDSAWEASHEFDHRSSYLITGAFGVLGNLVSRSLVQRGAGKLFLIGRHEPSAATADVIEQMRRSGAEVECILADVSDEDDMRKLFQRIAGDTRKLRGIVHAAGVLDDASVLRDTPERLRGVLAPKVAGAWHLHQFSHNCDLRFFVLFSSAASILGTPGQGNYASANGFLDLLAHYRRGKGLPAVTINWGPWLESGTAVKRDFLHAWDEAGGSAITPQQGLDLLWKILGSVAPQVAVLPIHLDDQVRKFEKRLPSRQPQNRLLPVGNTPDPESRSGFAEIKKQFEEASLSEKEEIAVQRLEQRLNELLDRDPAVSVPVDIDLIRLGVDSLIALEIRNELQALLGVNLPVTMFFDSPTINDMRLSLKEIISGTARQQLEPTRLPADYEQVVL